MIVFLDKLQERGLDSQEVGELLSVKDKKKEVKMSEPNIEDERETARENEKIKFQSQIRDEIDDLKQALLNEDESEISYWIRRIHQITGDYLYHESNNFSELIERS